MSKLLKSYDDIKEVSVILGNLNDINQIAKTLKSDNIYSIKNGKCYAYKSEMKDVLHQEVMFDFSSNRNRAAYNDSIKLINGVLNGKELFDWLKDAKKYVNKIEFYSDKFIIYTTNSNIKFESKSLDNAENLNYDINKFNDYKKRIKLKENSDKYIYENQHLEEIIGELDFSTMTTPYECVFSYKVKKKDGSIKKDSIKFRVTKKMFPTFKKESTIYVMVYPINKKDKVYQVIYDIINKVSTVRNYATIIKY